MTRKYFGTDGIRGQVGQAPITPDFVLRLGYAAGRVLAAKAARAGDRPAVVIGKDTRVSGYMFEAALESGFAAAGVDVMLVGPMPTPAVAYLARVLRASAGVVISASHNPYQDNGIKFFSGRGLKLPDEVELEIESQIDQPMGCAESIALGKARRINDAEGRYIEFCKSTFPAELDLRGLKIVLTAHMGRRITSPRACYPSWVQQWWRLALSQMASISMMVWARLTPKRWPLPSRHITPTWASRLMATPIVW